MISNTQNLDLNRSRLALRADAVSKPPKASRDSDARTRKRELSPEERAEIERLEKRDRRVRDNKNAISHKAGALAQGGPQYTLQRGPDGREYAVRGAVPLDLKPGQTPEDTVEKARQLREAALSPVDPSIDDLAIAAKAAQMEKEALAQVHRERIRDAVEKTYLEEPHSPPVQPEAETEEAATRVKALSVKQAASVFGSLDIQQSGLLLDKVA